MIAHGAKHPQLQISKGHVVGKAAGVDLSVVVTVRIAAVDEHAGSPEASHYSRAARACREATGLGLSRAFPIEARSKRPRTNFRPRSIPGYSASNA